MARCNSCSAPLPPNSNLCDYCQVRNDVDLQNKYNYSVVEQQSKRICPVCGTSLTTIGIDIGVKLYIERCDTCYGLFFDPGEIEQFMEYSVSGVFEINRQHLENINKDRYKRENKVVYKKCPECQEFMRRKNFGHKSGIVIDSCSSHGIWLDNGEITHIMEWRKAGGRLLHEKRQSEKKFKSHDNIISPHRTNCNISQNIKKRQSSKPTNSEEILGNLSNLLGRLFR